ncbi:MAG: hypothetical protein ACR2PT_21735 [Endozoicomonas sp.]
MESRSPGQRQNTDLTSAELGTAIAIFFFVLLVIVVTHSTALKMDHDSPYRTQAQTLASEMINDMMLNEKGRLAGGYDRVNSRVRAPNCVKDYSVAPARVDLLNTDSCSSAEQAVVNGLLWLEKLSRELPGGTGRVKMDRNTFYIQVSWNERVESNLVSKSYKVRAYL